MARDAAEIVELVLDGDRQALGELYDRFAPLVRAFCYDRTGDLQLAWDISQEVFLVILQDLVRLKKPARVQSWILSIARNKLVDHYRGQARSTPLQEQLAAKLFADVPCAAEREQASQLRQVIRHLPETERLAIQLFYLEGVSTRGVSELLEMPLRTTYALLARARENLRQQLAGDSTEAAS